MSGRMKYKTHVLFFFLCYFSYPRTESTAYPSSFDYRGTLRALARNSVWGDYVQQLLSDGYHTPKSGTDAGDHPPITPMSSATEDQLGHDAWKLYQYICQHFLGTLSPDCKYTRYVSIISIFHIFLYVCFCFCSCSWALQFNFSAIFFFFDHIFVIRKFHCTFNCSRDGRCI